MMPGGQPWHNPGCQTRVLMLAAVITAARVLARAGKGPGA